MSPESIDDNLDRVRVEWLRRLRAGEITREEAQGVLRGMKARLEFLQNLLSRIAEPESAEETRDVQEEIERQVDEIKTVERYVDQQPDGD